LNSPKRLNVLFALASADSLNENEAFCAQYLLYRIFKNFAQYQEITQLKAFHTKSNIKTYADRLLETLISFRTAYRLKDELPSEPWISIIRRNKFDEEENAPQLTIVMDR
jgi:hypothetical protein